jgi:hypothetical protein
MTLTKQTIEERISKTIRDNAEMLMDPDEPSSVKKNILSEDLFTLFLDIHMELIPEEEVTCPECGRIFTSTNRNKLRQELRAKARALRGK